MQMVKKIASKKLLAMTTQEIGAGKIIEQFELCLTQEIEQVCSELRL
jgi:hypothetical protein